MFIVGEDILANLKCFECKKYLSVKPVKLYPNRSIKCGRCSNPFDSGVNSLFGVLAEEALFPCVNRFDGCNQLLQYSEVANHEKLCVAKEYECPICIDEAFESSSYHIYHHFKETHSDFYLGNSPIFFIETENDLCNTYLYRQSDFLFFVNVRLDKFEQLLILTISYLGNEKTASNISQKFTLYTLEGKITYNSKTKSCCSVNSGNLKAVKVPLENYPKNVLICKFNLNMELVNSLLSMPDNLKKCKSNIEKIEQDVNNENESPVVSEHFEPQKYPVVTNNGFYTNSPSDFSWTSRPKTSTERKFKKPVFNYPNSKFTSSASSSNAGVSPMLQSGFGSPPIFKVASVSIPTFGTTSGDPFSAATTLNNASTNSPSVQPFSSQSSRFNKEKR